MRFHNNCSAICVIVLILLFISELTILGRKTESFQIEIYPRKVDLINDSFSIIKLLPGVGSKKASEIIELRKTIKSPIEIRNSVGLNKQKDGWEDLLLSEGDIEK